MKKIEYMSLPEQEWKSLQELWKEWWIASIIVEKRIILYREAKVTREMKKVCITAEFAEFSKKYPKKTGINAMNLIQRYAKLVSEWIHTEIIESLDRHIQKWESDNISKWRPKNCVDFVPNASTWINQTRWKEEIHSVFIPESKKVESQLEIMTSELEEKLKKKVRSVAKQYLEDHPSASLTESLISQIIKKYE